LKGQSTIEFLGALILFIVVVIGSLSVISDRMPTFERDVNDASQNMEMYTLTNKLMRTPGYHGEGTGGFNWEESSSTTSQVERIGLAEDFHVLSIEKIKALSTVGENKLNYSQFQDVTGVENQYRLRFVWMPVVTTSKSFERGEGEKASINEPDASFYSNLGERIHYGSFEVNGSSFNFLVAEDSGIYNVTYISEGDQNFEQDDRRVKGNSVMLNEYNFTVEDFQNREMTPGAALILKHELKTFGPRVDETAIDVKKIKRYGSLEMPDTDESIVRLEVLSW
jgi:hypothetical protein